MRCATARGLVGIRSIEEHCELVPAQARHQVIAADDLTDAGADLAQQRVPGLVPERVVDLLEVVQIDQQQGQSRCPGAASSGSAARACSSSSRR